MKCLQPKVKNVIYALPENADVIERFRLLLNKPDAYVHKYPGAGIRKDIKPPKRLIEAAVKVSRKYHIKNVVEEPKRLRQYLWSRVIPPEKDEVIKRGRELEIKLASTKLRQQTSGEELTEDKIEKEMVDIRQQALRRMKRTTYHWKPIEMDAYLSVVYLRSSLLANYSVLYSIMKEISERDTEFKPTSMLDFGSGLASSVWVVNELWDSVREHYCWDKSADISTLARLLLQDGEDHADIIYPGVYFRQMLDAHHAQKSGKFDLVVCSHTLFELPSRKARLEYLDRLWALTANYFLIADNGTLHGHRLIEEARMHILSKFKNDGLHTGHVFSPCSHDVVCPLLGHRPCNFETTYKYKVAEEPATDHIFFGKAPVGPPRDRARRGTSVKYSFVVLKKGERGPGVAAAPRILSPPRVSKSCVTCHMCCPDGKFREIKADAKTHRDIYNIMRQGVLGTRLPIMLPHADEGYEITSQRSQKQKTTTSANKIATKELS